MATVAGFFSGSSSQAQAPSTDILEIEIDSAYEGSRLDSRVLNSMLSLEHLIIANYENLSGFKFRNAVAQSYIPKFLAHHVKHREFLQKVIVTLGGVPSVPLSSYDIDKAASEKDAIGTLVELENLAVVSYAQNCAYLKSPKLVQSVNSMLAVDAWHTAAWRMAGGMDPAPTAFLQ